MAGLQKRAELADKRQEEADEIFWPFTKESRGDEIFLGLLLRKSAADVRKPFPKFCSPAQGGLGKIRNRNRTVTGRSVL